MVCKGKFLFYEMDSGKFWKDFVRRKKIFLIFDRVINILNVEIIIIVLFISDILNWVYLNLCFVVKLVLFKYVGGFYGKNCYLNFVINVIVLKF